MINLTILGKDKTKQVVNMKDIVLFDPKNKPLTDEQIAKKFGSIAQTIAGTNYNGFTFKVL